ncbi:hypothetical protein [Paenimyroides aestuarii]|uniref:Uncharacterized protein n=1 Tax=Paenimyroides aestuarii TaxID=2968490 RepID=A0ABY5NRB1_9FLAO|nr:hypothetical protein [Paenimyroides aestuarii]UUV21063.1 hypothetical protein NPX36_12155 [Paenimyroides aestuarii]
MKQIKKYFTIWGVPIIAYLIPLFLFYLAISIKSDILVELSIALFFLNLIGTFIAAIAQITVKKWYYILSQVLISIVLYFLFSTYIAIYNPDFYGAYKTIPKDIQIYEPISKELSNLTLIENDLILQQSHQPGIYNYYTTFNPKEAGTLYIKAFEITSNDRLSEERINMSSSINIEKIESKIYSGEFTIYEGSWGDKYGARIELWFKVKDNNVQYKITEKNYIVEGWMR